jgi:ABC-2 type transport system permease protein
MDSLNANIINELQKLFAKKKTWILLVITGIICFLSAFFITSIQLKLVFISMSSVSFPLMVLSVFTNVFLPLFIFMAASELFSGEIADKTLKLVLTMPISRLKVYISKIVAIGIYIFINLLVLFLVSSVSSLFLKLGTISIFPVFISYLIDIVPALILSIFAVFIVQFFKSSNSALVSCILIFVGIRVVTIFNSGLNNNMFTSYLDWNSLWFRGGVNLLRTGNIFLLLLSYGIIFFTLGYYLFDKREV